MEWLEEVKKEKLEMVIGDFWLGFQLTAYAIYDEEKVYLYNHPKYPASAEGYNVLKWNEQFVALGLILFEEHPTAIVDIRLMEDFESLYSLLIHELFHGYQYQCGESRKANESLGFSYPPINENIIYRARERLELHNFIMSTNRGDKLNFLSNFISNREKRKPLIEEYLEYENLVETIEGPAWYVEMHAYLSKSKLTFRKVLERYSGALLDNLDSNLNIRRSCYYSGLTICLALYEISPDDWRQDFMDSDKSLYEFLKDTVGSLPALTDETESAIDPEEIIRRIQEIRREEIGQYIKKANYHVLVESDIKILGYDPMNIVQADSRQLHKHFLKVQLNDESALIQSPVIARFEDEKVISLQLLLANKPHLEEGVLMIPGMIKIEGNWAEENGTYILKA